MTQVALVDSGSSHHRDDLIHRCGDTPFPGGVGKTTTPENFNSLLDDVKSRLFDVLPDDTWFYPGHGDDSTLGEQKPTSTNSAPAAGKRLSRGAAAA